MSLEQLARRYAILPRYRTIDGREAVVPAAALAALLKAMGIAADDAVACRRSLADAPPPRGEGMEVPAGIACYRPAFLDRHPAWGVTCQLYSLRSRRNWGIGDFEDLARLGEALAAFGADFIGVNPLHALFLADPERASPFSPSDRRFLNPLMIAVDRINAFTPSDIEAGVPARLRARDFVAYGEVTEVKLGALRRIHRRQRGKGFDPAFRRFAEAGGERLRQHALFEAISLAMRAAGHGAGWTTWPRALQEGPDAPAARAFAEEHGEEVEFQLWLQWVADMQLGEAARRLRSAGMRIALYLDLAVGTAPDGAATWSDRGLSLVGVEIGSPPDMFNPAGQNWGLAPLAPSALLARDFEPLRASYAAVMRHAGALRIDHAMSLHRLFWIPSGFAAGDGAYALYPMAGMLQALAQASRQARALVIGEDLGVVPEGFRQHMTQAGMLGYRLFHFERSGSAFRTPRDYEPLTLASIGSHDTPTLAGWWSGADITLRERLGGLDTQAATAARGRRSRDRRAIRALLASEGLPVPGRRFSPRLAEAVHRVLARAGSRLLAAQLEDLLASPDQVNVPGTVSEHPNWRRKIPVDIEDLGAHPHAAAILGAIAAGRPRR